MRVRELIAALQALPLDASVEARTLYANGMIDGIWERDLRTPIVVDKVVLGYKECDHAAHA